MQWKNPPVIKIYEALGAIGDDRIEVEGNEGKVFSSSRGKFYTVKYDPDANAITANDNGSYWQGYLGYPMIAYLMKIGKINFDPKFAEALKDIAWKDINSRLKNDFSKTENVIRQLVSKNGFDLAELNKQLVDISRQIDGLGLKKLPSNLKPPKAY